MDTKIALKIETFFTQFKQQVYKKGEILIRADEDPSGIFYLKTGLIKEYLLTRKGSEFVINIFKPGAFFPMSWAINNTHNSFYFEALTESEIFKAPKEKAVTFLQDNHDVLFDLTSRLYRGTDGLLMRMAYLMSGDASERLMTELVIHAKRFGKEGENDTVILTVSEKELATQTGLTRETVSRELKKLKEKNLAIFSQGTITMPRLSALESELL